MTKKQIEELRKARDREFNLFQSDDEEVRKSMRELNHFIDVMEEEGWNRNEAIVFLANTCRPK
jgi:hypothetical protein